MKEKDLRRNYATNMFGEMLGYEAFLRGNGYTDPLIGRIGDMTDDEALSSLSLLSVDELGDFLGEVHDREMEGTIDGDEIYWIFELLSDQLVSFPLEECKLRLEDAPNVETERFCRVRHQQMFCCSSDHLNRERRVVKWNPDHRTFVYPAWPTCRACGKPMFPEKETYVEVFEPFGFDPEPERTELWRNNTFGIEQG